LLLLLVLLSAASPATEHLIEEAELRGSGPCEYSDHYKEHASKFHGEELYVLSEKKKKTR